MNKFDTATGTAISPVWQQIGKQGCLTEQYFVFANNAKQQITKPQILKNQPQSMVWDSAYNGVNFVLKNQMRYQILLKVIYWEF